jgi:hypothetical protein
MTSVIERTIYFALGFGLTALAFWPPLRAGISDSVLFAGLCVILVAAGLRQFTTAPRLADTKCSGRWRGLLHFAFCGFPLAGTREMSCFGSFGSRVSWQLQWQSWQATSHFSLIAADCDRPKSSNKSLQPTALWRCASMSILITLSSTIAQPRSQSGG